jgi:hypothetical protein
VALCPSRPRTAAAQRVPLFTPLRGRQRPPRTRIHHSSAPRRAVPREQASQSSKRRKAEGEPPAPPTTYREGLTVATSSMSSSSSSSSSMGGSLALAAATAVAFSGSLVIFSLCRAHLSHVPEPEPEPEPEEGAPEHALRPCLLSSGTYTRPVALLPLSPVAAFVSLSADGILRF